MSSISVELYIKEFNNEVQKVQCRRLEGTEVLLNRSLSLIYDTDNLDIFALNSIETCQFFINLHNLIRCVDPKSDVIWSCILVLHQAAKNYETRSALVNQFKFVPEIARVLEKTIIQERILRVLTLLEDLSYEIKITRQEPYLANLIQTLLNLINGDNEQLGSLALSVLINLCYKNEISVYSLIRATPVSIFMEKIRIYGILAVKMDIILDNKTDGPSLSEVHNFIKQSFKEIIDCIENLNISYLRHIINFLRDSESNNQVFNGIQQYKNFESDVSKLIKSIESQIKNNYNKPDSKQLTCFSLVFEFLEFIFHIDKSLSTISVDVIKIVKEWISFSITSAKVLDFIQEIVKNATDEDFAAIVEELEKTLPSLVKNAIKDDASNEQIISLLGLLLILLRNSKSQTIVLTLVNDTFINKMFTPLLSIEPEVFDYTKISNDTIAICLLCLQILIEFSDIAPQSWLSKLNSLFLKKQIQFAIAKGLLCENEKLCAKVLELSKADDFPSEEISKIIVNLSPLLLAKIKPTDNNQNVSLIHMIENSKICISQQLEERMDALIEHILSAKNSGEFSNVATSELIELFQHKMARCANTETNLANRLEESNTEITNLSHRISLLSSEMLTHHSMTFQLHLTLERLQTENLDYKKQRDSLKEGLANLCAKSDAERVKYQTSAKSLEKKSAEIKALKKELDEHIKLISSNEIKIEELEKIKKDNQIRIENLKKNMQLFENSAKERQKLLEERDKELLKSLRTIEELKAIKTRSDNLIKHLEKQLAEKNEMIKAYETELSETEEMRRTILSLMESKKPKRKI